MTPVVFRGGIIVWSLRRVESAVSLSSSCWLNFFSMFVLKWKKKKKTDETVNSISLVSRLMTFQVANDLMLRLDMLFSGNYFNRKQLTLYQRKSFFYFISNQTKRQFCWKRVETFFNRIHRPSKITVPRWSVFHSICSSEIKSQKSIPFVWELFNVWLWMKNVSGIWRQRRTSLAV